MKNRLIILLLIAIAGAVGVVAYFEYFHRTDPIRTANSPSRISGTTIEQGVVAQRAPPAPGGDLTDREKLAVCAGDFTFLTLIMKQMPEHAGEAKKVKKLSYWFLNKSSKLIGMDKTIAYSAKTVEFLSARYGSGDKKQVLLEEMLHTGNCITLVKRLLPETEGCFVLNQNQYFGMSWDFVC